MKIPAGIPSNLPREVLCVSIAQSIEECEQRWGVTHYGFSVYFNGTGWAVSGRPWKNWKERHEAAMANAGF